MLSRSSTQEKRGKNLHNFIYAVGKQQVNPTHHDLQDADEIQYLQLN